MAGLPGRVLRSRFAVAGFFLVVLASFLVVMLAVHEEVKEEAVRLMNARQFIHARQAASGITGYFRQFIRLQEFVSQRRGIIMMDESGRRTIDDFQQRFADEVKGVTRVDTGGRILYTYPDRQAIGRDISSQEHFQRILKTRRPVLSDVFEAVQGFRTIAIHTPIFDRGAFVGSLAVLFSFDAIARRYVENIRVGEGGFAWLVSAQGVQLAGPDHDGTGRWFRESAGDAAAFQAMVDAMLAGREGTAVYPVTRRNGKTCEPFYRHAVYLPIPLGDSFWSIVVATPEEEILAPSGGLRTRLGFISILFLAICVIVVFLAVRARVMRLEQQKRETVVQALAESEDTFRRIFNGSADAILLLRAGQICECNDAALSLLGARRDEVLGAALTDFAPERQPEGRGSGELIAERLAGLGGNGQGRFEWTALRRSGGTICVEMSICMIVVGGMDLLHMTWRDISERKRAEAERGHLQDELYRVQRMESIGRLAGGVAHDFNNMLSVIRGRVELVLGSIGDEDPRRADLEEACQAAERSEKLTRQLLAFARRQPITPHLTDLNGVVDSTLQLLRRLIGENVVIEWIPGDGLWTVRVDQDQFEQVLTNLALNARDAGASRIVLASSNREGALPGVELVITDDGEGIAPEVREHLFEPFFTTKQEGRGTGLGLATVHGIVSQNGGEIRVRSVPGEGASFTIFLPRAQGTPEAATAAAHPAVMPRGTETILLVEDETMVLELNRIQLERLGYRVLAVATPGEALCLIEDRTEHVDLLLSDVIMPEMNGWKLSQRLLVHNPRLACLFVSGYTADVIGTQGVMPEDVHFLQKPFTIAELAEKVRFVLDVGRGPS
jgi:PAS domain S-box-containing protein